MSSGSGKYVVTPVPMDAQTPSSTTEQLPPSPTTSAPLVPPPATPAVRFRADASATDNGGPHADIQIPEEKERQLPLYQEDNPDLPAMLSEWVNYSAILPNAKERDECESLAESTPDSALSKRPQLGTLMGVYLPCLQNILGVILFLRLSWIVGCAGILEAFTIVFLCCLTTLLTAISMSAVATNGVVPAGGSYFMISRALGPEFGGAVGILFYLGTTFAASMYILGAVEIFMFYLVPGAAIFEIPSGPKGLTSPQMYNNMRVYGTCLLGAMAFLVFVGVKVVNKCASLFLACVIISIVAIYIGIFYRDNEPTVCKLDGVLLAESAGCPNPGENISAIPGLASGVISQNYMPKYLQLNQMENLTFLNEEKKKQGFLASDMTTSFMVLFGIFFPSVTGIMAGSNRSGDLRDAQASIPKGTIAAIITTSTIYLSCVLLFGSIVDGAVLRDKFGQSLGNQMIVSIMAWPTKWLILVGSLLSTIGAGLQSLTGAPRLLQAIAKDNVIPILRPFGSGKKGSGEPTWSLLLTASITEIGILIAVLDEVTPIITMFFLMCYMFVNMACALQTLLKTPNWRPRFRYYHWALSFMGMALCVGIMFITSWYYALTVFFIAFAIYKYIEFQGAEKEWGDGIRGLALSAARFSLLRLEVNPPHAKNWRPQLMLLAKLDTELQPIYPQLLDLANQLKAGSGLVIVGSVIRGNFLEVSDQAKRATANLRADLSDHKVRGFVHVAVARYEPAALATMVQTSGLGGLRPNTVVVGWPYGWRQSQDPSQYESFMAAVKHIAKANLAVAIPKNIHMWPASEKRFDSGFIDVWWIVQDGGMLILMAFLFQQHKVWKKCTMRIFTVAQAEDNSIQMKNDLEKFLYQLRIPAVVDVIEMTDQDIPEYTYQRTLAMEERTNLLKKIHLSRRQSKLEVQGISDMHRESYRRFSLIGDKVAEAVSEDQLSRKPLEYNVRKMDTAVKLNKLIRDRSSDSHLVITNLPPPPKDADCDSDYMEFLEALTEGIDRIILVRGSGKEVVTIYS